MRTKEREVTSIWLPSALSKEADEIAEKEGRTKSEFIREAIRQYIWITKWSQVRHYGFMKSTELKLRPDKIDTIVHAYRYGAKRN